MSTPLNNADGSNGLKVHLTTLGCSKNTYDSEILAGLLKYRGAKLVEEPSQADAIIINTCGFITPAKQESIDAILEAGRIKTTHGDKKLVVCGCLAQRYMTQLQAELPEVDAFFGTEAYQQILEFLGLDATYSPEFLYEQRFLSTPSHYAYLKISEGCNHSCAFCAIPLMRGRHRSRPISQLVAEAGRLAEAGVKELILVSQDTTFYGLDLYREQKLVALLQELEKISGLEWIRLHYLYPTTVQDELIQFMASSEKVVPYLDMPIQHASQRMLQIMRRGGTVERIRRIFSLARERMPEVTLRTSVIVGHPGEEEEDFQQLLQFIQEVQFDRLGVFLYSHEEGTPAFELPDLPEAVKEERYRCIMEVQQEISLRKNQQKVGQTIPVMIDEVLSEEKIVVGRTPGDSPEIDNEVIVQDAPHSVAPGEVRKVNILDATEYELYGNICLKGGEYS